MADLTHAIKITQLDPMSIINPVRVTLQPQPHGGEMVPCENGARTATDARCPCCNHRCIECHSFGCTEGDKCCSKSCNSPGVK